MKTQSKINFKRKKTNKSEVGFPRQKSQVDAFKKDLSKKGTFSRNKELNADQSSRIYSVESIPEIETHSDLRNKNRQKTNEILQKIENLQDSPENLKRTENAESRREEKSYFGKMGVFSGVNHRTTKKLKPVILNDDFEDPFFN